MASWQSAVVHPLGLAGYALACVFGLLAKFGPTDQYRWLPPAAIAMAFAALLGGLVLAFAKRRTSRRARASGSEDPTHVTSATQSTTGNQSPTIANVTGSVSIQFGEHSSGNKTH